MAASSPYPPGPVATTSSPMQYTTPPYYTRVRICIHCQRYFTEGEQMGKWECVRHLRKSAYFHPNIPPAHVCCSSTGDAIVNGLGKVFPGCVRHDHEDHDMEDAHATAVIEHNVNLEVQPNILFSRLGVAYPDGQSIVARVSAKDMRAWLRGRDLENSRRRIRVAMGETEIDLLALGKQITKKTLAGPYGTLARAEDNDMSISEVDGEAFVRATSEFRPSLPENDEGGAVVTMEDYYAEQRHLLEQEQGDIEVVGFVVFSRESFSRLPAAEGLLRNNLARWNCRTLGDWHRTYQPFLQDVLYTDKINVL